jgi:large subunit ribosomal protein L1
MSTGKQIRNAKEKVDRSRAYPLDEALALLKEGAFAKFDESVEVSIRLGVDPRKADQMIRGAVVLPNGLGKTVRVLVFAKGEKVQEAEAAGADFVGGDDLAEKIQGGWFDFDTAIAAPDMMGVVGKIGRLLGPRGLMPNPKVGTVTPDIERAVTEAKSGKIEYRVEKAGIIHAAVGKTSFDAGKLRENLLSLIDVLLKAKPSSAKGIYLKKISISSTMGPGILVDVTDVQVALR